MARTFAALNGGSVRGSIFSLCASAIGSGVLGLPYVCNLCGYVAGPVLMLIAANAANISLRMLIKLAVLGDLKSYSKICTTAGGPKLSLLLSLLITLFMFGSCIGY
jgi:amino acid permease